MVLLDVELVQSWTSSREVRTPEGQIWTPQQDDHCRINSLTAFREPVHHEEGEQKRSSPRRSLKTRRSQKQTKGQVTRSTGTERKRRRRGEDGGGTGLMRKKRKGRRRRRRFDEEEEAEGRRGGDEGEEGGGNYSHLSGMFVSCGKCGLNL